MKKIGVAIVVLLVGLSACTSDEVLVTENQRLAVFATLTDSSNVALKNIPVNVTTDRESEYNILGESKSKDLGRVDFVSLVSYNRGLIINFNPEYSKDYIPAYSSLSFIDSLNIEGREGIINLKLVQLSRIRNVNLNITMGAQTDSLEVVLMYPKKKQSLGLYDSQENNFLPENYIRNYLKLDEENTSFMDAFSIPEGSSIKINYTVNDEVERDTIVKVTSESNSFNFEF
ncbi:hypothetical protein [Zunongwangia sp. HRR-M8]|uniref:hypothetical protein n=1 Tax=Zunongwangia sp. HRR-M8 TaxID=3015170 RepID=UPI0022DD3535|nr:hypothetical protein [Zunongwangia sp. HRR-M8]WBL22422.1 hypothetical protein PBT89_00325 [Zunongwangia sp. HRR-M8]